MTSSYAILFLSFAFLGFSFLGPQIIGAQERELVRIYDVKGDDFAITIDEERTIHPIEVVRGGRIILEQSGIVHTGADTLMDIILIPSGTVVRVAENTSLIYNGLDEAGNFEDFGLLYGRIRVIAGNRERSMVIRGGGSSVRIMEGDFGIDHLIEADDWDFTSQPNFLVSVFQGSAEFFHDGLGSHFERGLTIEQGESMSTSGKRPLDTDTHEYWHLIPDTLGQPRVIFSLVPHTSVLSNRGKNTSLAIGLALTVASTATLIMTYPQFEIIKNRDLARNINNAAYIPLSMGLLTTLGGILYNPSRP